MTIALLHDHYTQDHLTEVQAEMVTMGAPEIKAVWMDCYDMWAALEGCHRIRAAHKMRLTPVIIELEYNDVADLDCNDPSLGLDMDNPGTTIAEMIDDCHRRKQFDFGH